LFGLVDFEVWTLGIGFSCEMIIEGEGIYVKGRGIMELE
jgi:hypothetical protein